MPKSRIFTAVDVPPGRDRLPAWRPGGPRRAGARRRAPSAARAGEREALVEAERPPPRPRREVLAVEPLHRQVRCPRRWTPWATCRAMVVVRAREDPRLPAERSVCSLPIGVQPHLEGEPAPRSRGRWADRPRPFPRILRRDRAPKRPARAGPRGACAEYRARAPARCRGGARGPGPTQRPLPPCPGDLPALRARRPRASPAPARLVFRRRLPPRLPGSVRLRVSLGGLAGSMTMAGYAAPNDEADRRRGGESAT